MKFQQFLKMKGHIHESEIADILKDADRLIEGYSYNSGEVLNESLDEVLKNVMSMISYTQAMGKLEDFKKVEFEGNVEGLTILIAQKVKPIIDKIALLTDKRTKTPGRQQKEAITKQIDVMKAKMDQMDANTDTIKQEKQNAKDKLGAEITDLEGAMLEPFKNLWGKTKAEATRGISMKVAELKSQAAKETKDTTRIANTAKDLKEITLNYEEAVKKLEDAENASEDDIKQLEGVKNYMTEIIAFVNAGKKLGIARKTLEGYYSQAQNSIDASESASDSKYIEFDYLTEEEKKETIDPATVLSKINAIPEKDNDGNADEVNIKTKADLLTKLKEVEKTFTAALKLQVEKKKELWDKVKKAASVTKDLITVAGGDPESATEVVVDGKITGYKAGDAIEKWKAAFANVNDYAPLKKLVSGMTYTDSNGDEKTRSFEKAIDAAVAELPQEAAAAAQSDYDQAVSDSYKKYSGTLTDLAAIKAELKDPTDAASEKKYKDAKEVEDPTDATKKIIMVKEGLKFKSSSRIVPTFESYMHARGLK